jgi:hypothetical protein
MVADHAPEVRAKIGHGLICPVPFPVLAIADDAPATDPGAA